MKDLIMYVNIVWVLQRQYVHWCRFWISSAVPFGFSTFQNKGIRNKHVYATQMIKAVKCFYQITVWERTRFCEYLPVKTRKFCQYFWQMTIHCERREQAKADIHYSLAVAEWNICFSMLFDVCSIHIHYDEYDAPHLQGISSGRMCAGATIF